MNTRPLTTPPTRSADRLKTRIAGVATTAPPAAPGPDATAPKQPRRSTNDEDAGFVTQPYPEEAHDRGRPQ